MQSMNRQLNMPQIQKILMDFEKQSEIMDMKEEMINDVMDDAMEDEGDEEETDAVVSQVLDELGLQLNDQLSGLPQVNEIDDRWAKYDTKLVPYFRRLDLCLWLARRYLRQQQWGQLEVVGSVEVVELVAVAEAVGLRRLFQTQMQTFRSGSIISGESRLPWKTAFETTFTTIILYLIYVYIPKNH